MCPYDLGVPGGVQTQVTGLAEELSLLGHAVVVIAPGAPGPPAGRPGPVRYERAGKSIGIPVNGSRAPVCLDPRSVPATLRALRRRQLDVVHVHEPMAPLVGLAAAAFGPRPVVATFHRSGSDAAYLAEGRALRPVTRRLAAAFAVSEAARETAGDVLGLRDLPIVPNGVRLSAGGRRTSGAPVPGSPGRISGAPVPGPRRIAFVGRHEERKGLSVLIDAMAGLGGDVALDVVGDGPRTAALRQRTSGDNRICWLGRLDDTSKAAVVAGSDLFVAPSLRGESFGVVLLEAMAEGTPVLASDLPGHRAAAGGAAVFVPAGDASALAGAISSLLGDEEARASLSAAGRARAEECSMAAVARSYVELYCSVAGQP